MDQGRRGTTTAMYCKIDGIERYPVSVFPKLDMSRLGRMRARLFLTLKTLPTNLIPPTRNASTVLLRDKAVTNTHLALQIKSSSIRIRAFGPQFRRKRLQGLQHALALDSVRGDHTRAELLGRLWRRSEHRGVVMDPRIDEQYAALRLRLRGSTIVGAGAASEAVDTAGLDVDARYLGPVVCGKDRELDRAAPGIRRENRADVFVAWTPVTTGEAKKNKTPKRCFFGGSGLRPTPVQY